jgi:hypothetical protein
MRIPDDAIIADEKLTHYILVPRLIWMRRARAMRSDILRDAETEQGDLSMHALRLYDRVALTAAVPEHRLRAGDVATLVEFVDHPAGGQRGCVLEVSNAIGESIAVIAVPESSVAPLRADEMLAVRPLAKAS